MSIPSPALFIKKHTEGLSMAIEPKQWLFNISFPEKCKETQKKHREKEKETVLAVAPLL